MKREIWWKALEASGLEHAVVAETARSAVMESDVLQHGERAPFHLRYRLDVDADWRVRRVDLALVGSTEGGLTLVGDGRGRWTDGDGRALPGFDGCLDVDISATPLTNTLPIRRGRLGVGESQEIAVVYFEAPELRARPTRQRYTRRADNVFLFEELVVHPGFAAEIVTDADGFVLEYPQLFERL